MEIRQTQIWIEFWSKEEYGCIFFLYPFQENKSRLLAGVYKLELMKVVTPNGV